MRQFPGTSAPHGSAEQPARNSAIRASAAQPALQSIRDVQQWLASESLPSASTEMQRVRMELQREALQCWEAMDSSSSLLTYDSLPVPQAEEPSWSSQSNGDWNVSAEQPAASIPLTVIIASAISGEYMMGLLNVDPDETVGSFKQRLQHETYEDVCYTYYLK